MSIPLLFSTKAYQYLLERTKLSLGANAEYGLIERMDYPDNEHYDRFLTDVRHRHVVLIGGTISDSATLELYDLAQGACQQGALSLTLVMPYFGYSTMERSVKSGEIVKARNRALLFSSLPSAPLGNRVLLFDLHTEGLPYYFDSGVQTEHIYCKKLIMTLARENCGHHFVLGATDAGRAKWVESLANEMGVKGAFLYKKRISGSETEITAINAAVKNETVMIYDDMIRTGGTLMKAAQAYHEAGAEKIMVITTHGLFTHGALEKIAEQALIQKVISLDTHPLSMNLQHPLLECHTMSGLIADHLVRSYE